MELLKKERIYTWCKKIPMALEIIAQNNPNTWTSRPNMNTQQSLYLHNFNNHYIHKIETFIRIVYRKCFLDVWLPATFGVLTCQFPLKSHWIYLMELTFPTEFINQNWWIWITNKGSVPIMIIQKIFIIFGHIYISIFTKYKNMYLLIPNKTSQLRVTSLV